MPQDPGKTPFRSADEATRSSASLRKKLARQLDASTHQLDPPEIPDHTLLRRIGAGACGEVWLARSALGTLRAVKIVYRARFKDDRPYEREFDGILKYEPVSRTHEGLVQVLHVGRNNEAGCFYYVMELADNAAESGLKDAASPSAENPESQPERSYRPRTLRSEIGNQLRLPPIEAAQFALRLARALGHLHAQGLIHRDIKPSNVIFVSGQPKLADIGLVTDVGSSQSFVGTEGFIPPEGPGTVQADIYALGKLIYELATGRDRMDFPQLPLTVRELSDRDALLELNEVVTRACAPRPEDRYSTATQLQAEMNLFLAGRSLRRSRTIERTLARFRKLAAAACVLLGAAVAALWFYQREMQHALEREQAAGDRARGEIALRQRAEAAERQARDQLYTALLEQARATVRSSDVGQRVRALDAVRRAAAITNSAQLRTEALAALTLPDLRFERELRTGSDAIMRWLDPAFERIALCRSRGPIEIRAVAEDRLLATLPASAHLLAYGATWSRDGRFLAIKRDYDGAGGVRADLEVWEVDAVRRVALIQDVRANARSFHPQKPQLLVAGSDGVVSLWDLETGEEVAQQKFEAAADNLAYSPDGTLVASSYRMTGNWGVSIHTAAEGRMAASNSFANYPSALAWHPSGNRIAITDYGGEVHLMDTRTGELQYLGRHKAEATTVAFSPAGDYLFTGGWERELICWDLRTLQRAMTIGLESYILQFRSDGKACALTTVAGVQLHAFETSTVHRRFTEDLGPRLRHAAFSPDGRWLAAAADKRIGVWDMSGSSPGALADGGSDTQIFWTPNGSELFGSARDQQFFRWRIQPAAARSAPPLLEKRGVAPPGGFTFFSVASNLVAWTSTRGSALGSVEELAPDGKEWAPTIPGINGLSPDGRWLGIYRPFGRVLHIHRLPGMEHIAALTNESRIAGFSFSPSGEELGIGSRDQVAFWSTESWTRTRVVTNSVGIMDLGVIYQPDGRGVWMARAYRTAGLFDARTLEPIFHLPTGTFPLAVSADGRQLAVTVDAQQLQLWDLVAVRQQLRELGLDWPED